MSVLIKGIKVHRGDCWACPCLDGEYGDCNVLEKDVHDIEYEECPLIELPDHGDLIDRDALKNELFFDTTDCDLEMIEFVYVSDAPVVISAERSEDEAD